MRPPSSSDVVDQNPSSALNPNNSLRMEPKENGDAQILATEFTEIRIWRIRPIQSTKTGGEKNGGHLRFGRQPKMLLEVFWLYLGEKSALHFEKRMFENK